MKLKNYFILLFLCICARHQVFADAPVITGDILCNTSISGNSICAGSQNVEFSIASVPDATTYEWTVTGDASISGANDGLSVIVNFNASGTATINVKAINGDGDDTKSLILALNVVPDVTLSANTSPICSDGSAIVTFTGGANASVDYQLNGTPGNIVLNGAGTNTLTIAGSMNITNNPMNATVQLVNAHQQFASPAMTCTKAMSANSTVVINPAPALSLSSAAGTNAQTICLTSAITNISYQLSGGATGATVGGLPIGLIHSVSGGVLTISGIPVQTGTFNYTVTSTGHTAPCTAATATGTITISPGAVLTLSSAAGTNAQTICQTSAITSITYQLSGGATGATVSGLPSGVTSGVSGTTLTISGTPTQTGTFNYTVTSTGHSAPCIAATATGTITIRPRAVLTLSSAAGTNVQTICQTSAITSITYQLSGGATGATVSGLPSGVTSVVSGTTLTISGTPTQTGTFNYTVTSTGHTAPCTAATATGTINVSQNTGVTLTSAATDIAACQNSAITPITYQFSGAVTSVSSAGLPAGISANFNTTTKVLTISGTPSVSGSFPYTLTSSGHTSPCVAAVAGGTITVNQNTGVSLSSAAATNNQTVCQNSPVTNITYQFSGAVNNVNVTGLPAGVTASYDNVTKIVTISGTPSVSGSFPYTLTSTGHTAPCIAATASGSIHVNNLPVVTITGTATICKYQSATVNFTGTNNSVVNYILNGVSDNITLDNTGHAGIIVNGSDNTGTGTISRHFQLTDVALPSTTCFNTASGDATVTINPSLPVAAVTDKVYCSGETINIPFTADNDTAVIHWYAVNANIASLGNGTGAISNITVSNSNNAPVGTTIKTYTVFTGNAVSCYSDTSGFDITVNHVPKVNVQGDIVACNGAAVTEIVFSGNHAQNVYRWTAANGTTIGTSNSGTAKIDAFTASNSSNTQAQSAAVNVKAFFRNTAGGAECAGEETDFDITVNPSPVAPVIESEMVASSTVCKQTSNQNFKTASPSGALSYRWSVSNASILSGTNSPNAIISFPNAGASTVTLTGSFTSTGCEAQSSRSFTVSNSTSTVPVIVYRQQILVCLQNDVLSYQWGYDDKATLLPTAIGGATQQQYQLSNPDFNNRYYWVKTVEANGCIQKTYYNKPTGVNDFETGSAQVVIYPNPYTTLFYVEAKDIAITTIKVMDMTGRVVKEQKAHKGINTVETNTIANGIYLLSVSNDAGIISQSTIIKN